MNVKARARERRYPLHVHISALFALLLISSGVVLGLFNYRQTSQIILTSSDQLFAQIRREVESDLQNTYQPIRHLLGLLALNEQNQMADGNQRMVLLPLFAQALRDNPKLASLYLGYADGDFFMVRPLRTARLKQIFDAPDNAAYQVWSIDRSGQARAVSESQYFDADLKLISRRQNLNERYDPSTRTWYTSALADGEQITTEPYVFFSSGEIGTTLARTSHERTVIAADLTLEDLSATLARHVVTPSTEVVLYRPDGAAIAYPDSSRLVVPGEKAHLVQVQQLSPALRDLFDSALQQDKQGSMQLANRRWQVSYTALAEGGPNGLRLALLTPEDELLADAYRIRWQGAMLTLGILLLCIPFGWLMSRLLVRPLHGLVQEVEAIHRFDFDHPAGGRSPVLEVDQLAAAMARMKKRLCAFLAINANLSADARLDTLLQRVLHETLALSGARCGLLYLRDANDGLLRPCSLLIDDQPRDINEYRIPGDTTSLPHWLEQPANGGASAVISLGFDQAGAFQPLLHALDSPRAHVVSCGLHNRQGDTIGVLVLIQQDQGEERDLALLRPERVAYIEAVADIAAVRIDTLQQK